MIDSIAQQVWEIGDQLPPRSQYSILASLTSEVGELAEEVAIANGDSYKKPGIDGILGEAIDVLICAYDLIRRTHPNVTEAELDIYARQKVEKWKSKSVEYFAAIDRAE